MTDVKDHYVLPIGFGAHTRRAKKEDEPAPGIECRRGCGYMNQTEYSLVIKHWCPKCGNYLQEKKL